MNKNENKMKLVFGDANAKLESLQKLYGGKVYTFSLLSGETCPYAKNCYSKAVVGDDGRRHIEDGKHTEFRCFSASQEVQYTPVYQSRLNNFAIVELAAVSVESAADAIVSALPPKAAIIRIHVGGDFKTKAYFDAWIEVARRCPNILFYAYTKSLPFWVQRIDVIPSNLVLTASYGGWKDGLIAEYGLRSAKVVFSEDEAKQLGLEIDHDDSHAANPLVGDFALLIHGTQPAGTDAAAAKSKLKKAGWAGYGKGGRVKA
jgi:hypothetical protein